MEILYPNVNNIANQIYQSGTFLKLLIFTTSDFNHRIDSVDKNISLWQTSNMPPICGIVIYMNDLIPTIDDTTRTGVRSTLAQLQFLDWTIIDAVRVKYYKRIDE